MIMKKYSVLMTDFDGTLANSKSQISPENLSAIKGFISRGGTFVVSTGRMTESIIRILKDNEINCLCFSFNGGEFNDLINNKTIYKRQIDNKRLLQCLKDFSKLPLNIQTYSNGELVLERCHEYLNFYEKITGIKAKLVSSLYGYYKETGIASSKILIINDKEVIDKYMPQIMEIVGDLSVAKSSDILFEITLNGINKGTSCKELAKYLNVSTNDIIAVGDSGNDVEMLKTAGLSFAVENGVEQAKKTAKMIAPSNDEHAIKYIIENYCI